MKVHIAVEADSRVWCTPCAARLAIWPMSLKAMRCCMKQETVVFADAAYQAADKCTDARPDVHCQVTMLPGKRKKLDKQTVPLMRS